MVGGLMKGRVLAATAINAKPNMNVRGISATVLVSAVGFVSLHFQSSYSRSSHS